MTMTLPPSITHPAEALVLARIAPAVRERAAAVRLMVFDVDGVLTDGGLYYGETGEVQKRFNALDGHGLRLLMEGGLKVALMTGRSGPIVARRAAELGISEIMQGVRDKGAALHFRDHAGRARQGRRAGRTCAAQRGPTEPDRLHGR